MNAALKTFRVAALACALLFCTSGPALGFGTEVVVSVADQELALISRGKTVARYPVSTSKFGLGDGVGTYRTPLGTLYVSGKVGDGLPAGAVIKSRIPTGEVLAPNSPGRDPIVSRVLWLRGKEEQNRNARERCIYIHGTAEEKRIGRRASFGCIRMRSQDVIALYQRVHIGTPVIISEKRLAEFLPPEEETLLARQD
jgi:lipoprotein-anchoring transpeptidase ErfK/SrfK